MQVPSKIPLKISKDIPRLLNLQQLLGSARVYFRRFSARPWMPSDSSLMFIDVHWICQFHWISSSHHCTAAAQLREPGEPHTPFAGPFSCLEGSTVLGKNRFLSWCSLQLLKKKNILDFAGHKTYSDALFTELSELMSSSTLDLHNLTQHKPKRSGPCRSCPHPLLLHTSLLPAAPHQSTVHQLFISFS